MALHYDPRDLQGGAAYVLFKYVCGLISEHLTGSAHSAGFKVRTSSSDKAVADAGVHPDLARIPKYIDQESERCFFLVAQKLIVV